MSILNFLAQYWWEVWLGLAIITNIVSYLLATRLTECSLGEVLLVAILSPMLLPFFLADLIKDSFSFTVWVKR